MVRWSVRLVTMALTGAAWAAVASADTLIMRDGSRRAGRLVAVRNGVVEFEEGRRIGGPRVVRVDLGDVRAMEFDRRGDDDREFDDRDGRDDRDGVGRPRGLREREVRVPARAAWTDTGIVLRAGQRIYVEASGRVQWGPRRQDGPDGERDSPRNAGRPMPGRPGAALIGRIGDDAPFFIGGGQDALRVRTSGTLYLGINDDVLDDNAGEFRVTIHY